jgi:hypothetical protein
MRDPHNHLSFGPLLKACNRLIRCSQSFSIEIRLLCNVSDNGTGSWNSQKGRPNIKREILPIRTGHGTGDSFCNPLCLGSDISHYPPSTRTAPAVLQKPSSTTVSFVLLLAPSRIPRPSSETTSGTTANSRDPHFEAQTSCLQCHFS